jgi:hypothetical protein
LHVRFQVGPAREPVGVNTENEMQELFRLSSRCC